MKTLLILIGVTFLSQAAQSADFKDYGIYRCSVACQTPTQIYFVSTTFKVFASSLEGLSNFEAQELINDIAEANASPDCALKVVNETFDAISRGCSLIGGQ